MADDEKPGAGGAGKGGSTTTEREVVFVDANVESLAARHGGKDGAIKHLFRDAKRARDRARAAEEARDKAIADAKPKDGEVRLLGDDAKAWASYQKLGKPEEIEPKLKEHGTLSEKVKGVELRTLHEKAATAAGFKNADALHDLAETKKLNIVLKQEKVNDKDVDVAYVQPGEAGAVPVKLTDYVDKHLAVYKPALVAQSANQNGAGGAADGARRTPHPEQGTVTTPPAKPAGAGIPGVPARVLPSQRGEKKA